MIIKGMSLNALQPPDKEGLEDNRRYGWKMVIK